MKKPLKTMTANYVHTQWLHNQPGKSPEVIQDLSDSRVIYIDKPAEPVISKPDSTGYRRPTSYYTSIGPGHLLATAEGNGYKADYWENPLYERHMTISGTVLFRDVFVAPAGTIGHNMTNLVRMKVLNNIQDEVFDVAMVLAEMQSTVNTATSMLDRIGRSMLAFRKKNPKSFYYLLNGRTKDGKRPTERFLKQTAGEYLQWKYGIMPSVYDLQGACRALDINEKGSLFDNPPLLVSRAIVEDISTGTTTIRSGWHSIPGVKYTQKSTIKARCDFSVNAEGVRGLNRYGIGLSTIATVAWDKTPFTFVLDMVVPISSLIKAWGALAGTNVAGYCETRRVSTKYDDSTHLMFDDIPYVLSLKGDEFFDFRRDAYTTVPMPLPMVRNPIKTGNLATVLALFTSLRK